MRATGCSPFHHLAREIRSITGSFFSWLYLEPQAKNR
jgi:hypothetical protein